MKKDFQDLLVRIHLSILVFRKIPLSKKLALIKKMKVIINFQNKKKILKITQTRNN